MDLSLFFRALKTYAWLVLIGVVVAAIAGFLTGFTVVDGKPQLRAQPSYTASTTLMLSSDRQSVYQAQIPGQTVKAGQTAPQQQSLASLAITYAYLASGSQIRDEVSSSIGGMRTGESLTAASRTNQPASNAANVGRYNLPFLDVIATSPSAARAVAISRAASEAFQSLVAAEQTQQKITAANRVSLTRISDPVATAVDQSNPYVPVIAVAVGVVIAFVALSVLLFNLRLRSELRGDRPKRTRGRRGKPVEPADTVDVESSASEQRAVTAPGYVAASVASAPGHGG